MTVSLIILNTFALIISFIIVLVFFSKIRPHKIEDDIYANILIISTLTIFIGVIVGILPEFISEKGLNSIYNILLNKLYLISLTITILHVLFYTYAMSKLNKYTKSFNMKVFALLCVIYITSIIFLPIEVVNNGVVRGVSGVGVDVTFSILGITYMLMSILVIADYKKFKDKKYIPVVLTIVEGILMVIIQSLFPEINYLINPSITLVCLVMYFTIENPDVKMLEEFKLAKDRAEKANEEKELFLYNMTQDVRLPLYDIRKASDWLSDNVKEIHEKDIKDGMYYINSKASNVLEKVNNILDITNMEVTNIKVYNTKYDIRLLLEELNRNYKNKPNKGVKLKFNIDSNMPDYLDGDMLRLKQLITIILDNSCEHTEKGFIEVNLNTVVKRGICRLILSIEDTGCGIKASDIDEIFNKDNQMYASLDKVDDNKKNLAIAKSIATLLGGILMLESEIGAGTKVTLVLDQKIYEEKSESLEKLEGDSKKYIALPKVMAVSEDNEYLNEIVKKLSKYEIEVEALDLGEKCLNKIRLRHKYDLIIMDEELKKLNALEILKKLKEINGFDIPVAILTNNTDNLGFVKAGFNYVLNRKTTKKELDELINGIE